MIKFDKNPRNLSNKFLLKYHRKLLTDEIRIKAYRESIENEINKGDIVADLGCGTGILSFFACQSEAKKVYSIEESSFLIKLAKRISNFNNFERKISFLNKNSLVIENLDIKEKINVLITEIMGSFGLEENILTYIIDFRDRFMNKTNIKIIPNRLKLYIIPYENEDFYKKDELELNWLNTNYNLDFKDFTLINKELAFIPDDLKSRINKKNFITDPIEISNIDLLNVKKVDLDIKCKIKIKNLKNIRKLHGFCGFFKAILSSNPNVNLTNSPLEPDTSFSQIYFPIKNPQKIRNGDIIKIHLNYSPPVNWNLEYSII